MTSLRPLLLSALLACTLFAVLLPTPADRGSPRMFDSAASPTFTMTPANVTASPAENAYATVTVAAVGTAPVTVNLKVGSYNTDYLACDDAPRPATVTASPAVNATIGCTCADSGSFTVQIIGTDANNPNVTELVLVTFNFVQAHNSSSTTTVPLSIPLIYEALSAGLVVIGVMSIIGVYAFRKWKV